MVVFKNTVPFIKLGERVMLSAEVKTSVKRAREWYFHMLLSVRARGNFVNGSENSKAIGRKILMIRVL
jgi:hypothetical protein